MYHLIRVPHGLERAIDAALAENLYAIVFEHEADMRLATSMLLEGDAGRATMFALDAFQEHRALNLIKERGIIGVASALVRCDSRYRKLVDTLLGRTVVVQNLALAERVVRRGLAASVVTPDGVLLRPLGSISAGTVAAVEVAFHHEREMQDLPLEIERLRPLVADREAAAGGNGGAHRRGRAEEHGADGHRRPAARAERPASRRSTPPRASGLQPSARA